MITDLHCPLCGLRLRENRSGAGGVEVGSMHCRRGHFVEVREFSGEISDRRMVITFDPDDA